MTTFSGHPSAVIPAVILLLSLPPLCFYLAPHIHPQPRIDITLTDELDDVSLFHKAIHMDVRRQSPHSMKSPHLPSHKWHLSTNSMPRQPKIAFLFLTNSALHFQPLWIRFFDKAPASLYNIYIHADPFAKVPSVEGPFRDRIIKGRKTQRSSPTLISAARRLIANAMVDDRSNEYFALISQHCIPLHSFNFLYSFLFDVRKLRKRNGLKSYIEILEDQPFLRDRYNARGENVMIPEVKFEEFRIGSQFFVMSRKHSVMVIKDVKLWRKFKLPCLNVHSCYPEEHYFPTLLSMNDLDSCSKYTLTSVNWTGSVDGHPYTYSPGEVSTDLIYRLRESNSSSYEHMFARKFSPDCLGPLMEIADSVIFRD